MSDLQCPVRLFVVCVDDVRPREVAAAVAEQRIVHVWSSPRPSALGIAEIVAADLGAGVSAAEGLAGGDAGQDSADAEGRFRAVLEEIADLHRGESVLVVSHVPVVSTALPSLAAGLGPAHVRGRPWGHGTVVQVDGDADGWVARSWSGEPLG